MSWWVCLQDDGGDNVKVDTHEEGGTYALGGVSEAELNITYNYSRLYFNHLDSDEGLRYINGKRARDVIEKLESAVDTLGIEIDDDYWKATPGNAGFALSILLKWAKQYPDATFFAD